MTAVEWLESEFNKWAEGGLFIPPHIITQAKEIEKQQIINSHLNGQAEFDTEAYRHEVITNAEQYYNETYKSE